MTSKSNVLEDEEVTISGSDFNSDSNSTQDSKGSPIMNDMECVNAESLRKDSLDLESSPETNVSNVKTNKCQNQSKKQKNKKQNSKKEKGKPKEKKMTKWEFDYYATQKIRQEVLKKVNAEIEQMQEKEKRELLRENKQSIKFNDELNIREFMKCTDSIRFIKKKNKRNRNANAKEEEANANEPKQDSEPKERIYKELTVKSSLKSSNSLFTYSFPVTS